MNKIGSLNEQPLHASLKQWYAGDDGRVEVLIDGYIVDVFKENSIIEIQTGSFSSIKSKMFKLAAENDLKLVYPIAAEKWLLKYMEGNSAEITTRKSPKRGFQAEVFTELVSFPELLCSKRFSLEIAIYDQGARSSCLHRRKALAAAWLGHCRATAARSFENTDVSASRRFFRTSSNRSTRSFHNAGHFKVR